MAGPLDSVPFYGAFRQRTAENEQAGTQDLARMGALAQLAQTFQAQQRAAQAQDQLRQFQAQVAADPSKARDLAMGMATPQDILRMPQSPRPLADNRPEVLKLAEVLQGLPEEHPNRPLIEGRIKFLNEGRPQAPKAVEKWSEPYELNGVTVQKNEETGQIRTAASRPPQIRVEPQPPAPTIITDEQGNVKAYDRQMNLIKDLGKTGKPSAQVQIAAQAKTKAKQDIERAIVELGKATQDGGLIDKSTGSGAGALVDIGAGFIGQATPGAIAVGQLKPIYDMVLKMVPRFEGPQSDKDTKTYQDAAGQLANPAVPNAQKKAAGREILRLMMQRRNQFDTVDSATAPSAATGGVKFLGFE